MNNLRCQSVNILNANEAFVNVEKKETCPLCKAQCDKYHGQEVITSRQVSQESIYVVEK